MEKYCYLFQMFNFLDFFSQWKNTTMKILPRCKQSIGIILQKTTGFILKERIAASFFPHLLRTNSVVVSIPPSSGTIGKEQNSVPFDSIVLFALFETKIEEWAEEG